MFLKELDIKHFRNYGQQKLTFHQNITLFLGQNAQGKTNLMESIYVLALTKSHRSTKDKEWINWDEEFSWIKGTVERKRGPLQLEIQLTGKGKKAKINGLEQKKLSDYIGAMNVVMFAPEDLSIVKGTPQQRRKFVDMEIGQVSPMYLHLLSQYQKVLTQRNQCLKDAYKNKKYISFLDILNEQLAELAVKIISRRIDFLKKMGIWANNVHQGITQGKETLTLEYLPSFPLAQDKSDQETMGQFIRQLDQLKEKEIARGTTLLGPHRDDLTFHINGTNVQQYGSQGQQRTTALSLKLAEIQLIYEEIGEYPILLLDDVLSELDASRQSHLLDAIKDRVQTFVTTTGVEGLHHETLENASIFRIHAGQATMEK
ncbi:DNA replication/repair protein RecF [Ammoniphilus sp. CFH 90114]|uniref:DNA replication/repair protein RecF n=1 Tax=Ammoniphilus sp. CFH 90114 TaxID=2493665 RepID=UPI00100F7970|nr:DNA replication/repair protein RecF [Ammoniphilus sp. CFH 90114]RXT08902.1 DNA replication/repair protein RecF [Ammoniphilus sp. CFH 90114]